MGTFATLLFWASSQQPAPVDLVQPKPAPVVNEPFTCIIFDEPEPVLLDPVCPHSFPDLPAVSFLDPCPDRIDEILADAERIGP